MEGRESVSVLEREVGVPGEEVGESELGALEGGPVEGRAVEGVLGVDGDAPAEEEEDGERLVALGRHVDGLDALPVLHVQVAALLAEQLQHFCVPVKRREVDRRELVVALRRLLHPTLKPSFFVFF